MTRPLRCLALAALALSSACGPGVPVASFGSYAGVLGCADLVVWASVADVEPAPDGLEVTLEVEQWLVPSAGPDTTTIVADDPAEQVGAPAWPTSTARQLVISSPVSPTEHLDAAEGERAVRVWREAGSPRRSGREC